MKPQRIKRERKAGWRKPENTENVTRPGKWGNPYELPKGAPLEEIMDSIQKFKSDLSAGVLRTGKERQWHVTIEDVRRELKGKNLMCYCPLDLPCHSDVLLEVANGSEWQPGKEVTEMKMFSKDYHCDLCRCPIEVWKPYRDYPSDRSCEVFYFLEDLLVREKGAEFTVDGFVKKYRREVKQEFQDLKNLKGVFKEHLEWQTDIADVKEVSPGVYIAPLWPEWKEPKK